MEKNNFLKSAGVISIVAVVVIGCMHSVASINSRNNIYVQDDLKYYSEDLGYLANRLGELNTNIAITSLEIEELGKEIEDGQGSNYIKTYIGSVSGYWYNAYFCNIYPSIPKIDGYVPRLAILGAPTSPTAAYCHPTRVCNQIYNENDTSTRFMLMCDSIGSTVGVTYSYTVIYTKKR